LIATGVGLTLVALLPAGLKEIVSVGTRRGEGLDTLSGRTEAFSYLMDQWHGSPLLGYGFAAGTRNALLDFVARSGLNIGAGHDALSTVLVDLGIIGFLLLLVAYASAWLAVGRLYQATRSRRDATVIVHQLVCLLVFVGFKAIVDKSLALPFPVFMVALVAMWTLRKKVLTQPAPTARRARIGARETAAAGGP
jgi:O-antigen ligase